MYRLESTEFNVVSSSQEHVELSFRSTYNPSRQDSVRLNVDKRWHIHYSDYTSIYFDLFLSSEMVPNSHWNLLPKKKNCFFRLVLLKGSSGFYCYAIFGHAGNWPAMNISEARLAFKLNTDKWVPVFFLQTLMIRNLSELVTESSWASWFFAYNKRVLGSTTWRFQTTYSDTCPAQQTEMNLMVLHWPTKRLSCSLTPRSHSSRERSIAQTCLTYSTRTS